jgi:hypothetical protein
VSGRARARCAAACACRHADAHAWLRWRAWRRAGPAGDPVAAAALHCAHHNDCNRRYNFIAAGGAVSDLDPKLAWVTELTQECAEFLAELPFSLELRG